MAPAGAFSSTSGQSGAAVKARQIVCSFLSFLGYFLLSFILLFFGRVKGPAMTSSVCTLAHYKSVLSPVWHGAIRWHGDIQISCLDT